MLQSHSRHNQGYIEYNTATNMRKANNDGRERPTTNERYSRTTICNYRGGQRSAHHTIWPRRFHQKPVWNAINYSFHLHYWAVLYLTPPSISAKVHLDPGTQISCISGPFQLLSAFITLLARPESRSLAGDRQQRANPVNRGSQLP